MSATVTTTSVSQAGQAAREHWARSDSMMGAHAATEEHAREFMTSNNGVTGREPNTNPADWPTDHRRVPAHRPPHIHEDWVEIGGPAPLRLFLWTMFNGCELLRVRMIPIPCPRPACSCRPRPPLW